MLKCHLNAEKNMKKWEWKKTCAAPRRQSVFVHVTWTKCHNLLPAMLSQAWFSFSLSRYALLIRDDQKGVTSPAKVCCLYILASAIRFWGILSTVLTSIGLLVLFVSISNQKEFWSRYVVKLNFIFFMSKQELYRRKGKYIDIVSFKLLTLSSPQIRGQ